MLIKIQIQLFLFIIIIIWSTYNIVDTEKWEDKKDMRIYYIFAFINTVKSKWIFDRKLTNDNING